VTAYMAAVAYYTEWVKKTAHGFHCNNFVFSVLSINFHNFWHIYTMGNLQLDDAVMSYN